MGIYGCLLLAVRPKRATPVTDIGTALAVAVADMIWMYACM